MAPLREHAARITLAFVLRFSLGDIPVKVHFSFLVIAILSPSNRPVDIAAWTSVVFLAVLLHEAGHAFMARHYGAVPVTITLFALGGVTVYPVTQDLTPGKRFVISAMGSVVGIVTGGVAAIAWFSGVVDDASTVVRVAVVSFAWAGLGWGLLNWIPIRPLDGGAMLTSFLEIVWPKRALVAAKTVSLVAGIAAAFFLWRYGSRFGAFFVLLIMVFGLFGNDGRIPNEVDEPDEAGDAVEPPRPPPPDDPPAFPI